MKKFNIEVSDRWHVYINGKMHFFELLMDKEDEQADIDKKILLALANEMDYEPVYLFEEIVDRLEEIVNEVGEQDER